jgi:2-polyprenyl-3-methyl-5-hydroxy-6-metoxy-1,4-benzoquinol methylase
MNSPKQWLRSRLYNFVLRTVGDVVRPSDLLHLNSNFGQIRTDVANLGESLAAVNHELMELRARLSDTSWQNHVNEATQNIGNHLNSVHEEVRSFGLHLNSVHEEVKSFGLHLNSVHEEVKSTIDVLHQIVESHERLQHKFAIQESQVRAKPFSTKSIEVTSSRDGRPTIGYAAPQGGNYVDFIDNFRPVFSELLSHLTYVTAWLPSSGKAVDLGAGRGEMVTILRSHGLEAFGIDSDSSVVSDARNRKIDVRHQDIDTFLQSEPQLSIDVITAIQVVEHVDTMNLENWFQKIHQLLRPGGVFIAETPNPHAIDAFKAFWIDTTHVRPYYPESLLHMAQKAGFVSAEIWVEGTEDSIDERLGRAGSYTLIAIA